MEPNSFQNRSKNRLKNRCLLKSIFEWMLVGFVGENGTKLAPKWDQKSMLTSKGRFCKNTYKTNRILMIFEVREVEKSIKNLSKIDQKMESKMECLLASIFDRFLINFGRFWEASWDAKSIKNRLKKASKNRCQKKGEYEASWRHLGPSRGRQSSDESKAGGGCQVP